MAPEDGSGKVQLCMYSAGIGEHAVRQITINKDQSWEVYAQGRQCTLTWSDFVQSVTDEHSLQHLLQTVQGAQICQGCPMEKYRELLERNADKFYGRDGQLIAEVDPEFTQNRAIRTVPCTALLPGTNTVANACNVCPSCKHFDSTLGAVANYRCFFFKRTVFVWGRG